jgi:hypothetical protein
MAAAVRGLVTFYLNVLAPTLQSSLGYGMLRHKPPGNVKPFNVDSARTAGRRQLHHMSTLSGVAGSPLFLAF